MSYNRDIELSALPSLTKGYLKAAGQLVTKSLFVKHGGELPYIPATRFVLKNFKLNPSDIKKYTDNTQLANRNILPITYLYSVAFPIVIKLLTERDFPYAPVGLVHLFNTIKQYKEIATDAVVDIYVHAENMREHRSGLLVDLITEVFVDNELVWSQVSAMLRKQKTSLSGGTKEEKEKFDKKNIFKQDKIKVDAKIIRDYASISGDRNPIHMSPLTAKLFGFPQMIAHGSWMMARVLSSTEEQLPAACRYDIQFGKPFLVPGNAELFMNQSDDSGWLYSLEKPEKETVILAAQVTAL